MIERLAEQKGILVVSTIDPTNPKAKFKEISGESLSLTWQLTLLTQAQF